jgi:phage gp29-like protein
MSLFGYIASAIDKAALNMVRDIGRVNVVRPQSLYLSSSVRIGGELGPVQVSNIITQADVGYLWQLVDLARESREKDCHLHAVLSTFELSLSGMNVNVVPASDDDFDKEVAAFVEEVLAQFGPYPENDQACDLYTLIQHLAGGFYYSHAVAELIWGYRDKRLVPIAAEPVQPRRFVVEANTNRLHFWDPQGGLAYPGINLKAVYPYRFIQFEPIVLGTGRAREGLMRPLVWAAMFRNWAFRDWMSLAELAWKPWRVGYYDKNEYASEADIQSLINAVNLLTTNGGTVLPKTVKLDVEWPKGASGGKGGSAHRELVEFMANEMSKAVLGQTMTTESGSSWSQARVHQEVRQDRRDAAARAIAAVLQMQLVGPAVWLNFGKTRRVGTKDVDVRLPIIRLAANDTNDAALSEMLVKLCKELGLPVPVRWIYDIFGIPAPKPGEQVLGNPNLLRVPTDDEVRQVEASRRRLRVATMTAEEARRIAAEQEALALAEQEAEEALAKNTARSSRRMYHP